MKCGRLLISICIFSLILLEMSFALAQNETGPSTVFHQSPKQSLGELKKRIAQNPKDFTSRVQLSEIYFKQKDYDKMIDTLRVSSDSLGRRGLLLLAYAYDGKKNYLNEIRVLENLLIQNDKDYYIQFKLGEAYSKIKKREEAITNFRSSKQSNPHFLPAYESLLRELNSTEDSYEARTLINDMIKLFGEKPKFFTELCRLYFTDSFIQKSLDICKEAIDKDPRVPENHVYLGKILKDSGNSKQAERVLYKAAQQFPNSEFAQSAAGQFATDAEDFSTAYKFFAQGAKADPQAVRALVGLGRAAVELGKFQESTNAYLSACKIQPGTIRDFRVGAGTARKKHDIIWTQKFEEAMAKCPNN